MRALKSELCLSSVHFHTSLPTELPFFCQVGKMADTVFAIQGEDFVLMGADTSANQSIIRMKVGEDKILEASSHMIMVGFPVTPVGRRSLPLIRSSMLVETLQN